MTVVVDWGCIDKLGSFLVAWADAGLHGYIQVDRACMHNRFVVEDLDLNLRYALGHCERMVWRCPVGVSHFSEGMDLNSGHGLVEKQIPCLVVSSYVALQDVACVDGAYAVRGPLAEGNPYRCHRRHHPWYYLFL